MSGVATVWTASKVKQASLLWQQGQSATEIGKVFGVNRSCILGLASRNREAFPLRGAGTQPPSRKKKGSKTTKAVAKRSNSETIRVTKAAVAKAEPKAKAAPPAPPAFAQTIVDGRLTGGLAPKLSLQPFRLEHVESVAFADLRTGQCKFPLVPFHDVAGPKSPCCGAAVEDLQSWCLAHKKLVYRVRAA